MPETQKREPFQTKWWIVCAKLMKCIAYSDPIVFGQLCLTGIVCQRKRNTATIEEYGSTEIVCFQNPISDSHRKSAKMHLLCLWGTNFEFSQTVFHPHW
jgi:hypothetical protein